MGHLYVLLGEVSIQVLYPFLIGLFVFLSIGLVLSCMSSLYILEIKSLSDVSLTNMFSHTVGSLSILMTVSLAVQKLFKFDVVLFVYFPYSRRYIGKNIVMRDV